MMTRLRLVFAFLVFLLLIVYADPAGAAGFNVSGIKASRFLVAPGAAISIRALVRNTNPDRAEEIIVVLSLNDPFGNPFPGAERIVTGQVFNPGQGRTYKLLWQAPADLTPGSYSVSIDVFSGDWRQMFASETQDFAFVAQSTELQFAVKSTGVTPKTASAGGTIKVTTQVLDASLAAASDIVVMCEVNDESGDTNFLSDFIDGLHFSRGQTRSLSFVFELPVDLEPGTYTIDVAVFAGGWSQLYTYRFIAATFTVN
jgi:uncharacterized membrane protein